MLGYVQAHWAGRQALAWSFWVNFALLCIVINLVESLIRPATSPSSWFSIILATTYLIVGHLVIYPWQVIGLIRACNKHLKQSSDSAIVTAAQLMIVASVIAGMVTMATTIQSIVEATSDRTPNSAKLDTDAVPPAYKIKLIADEFLILIDGEFVPGLTRDLKELLNSGSDVRGVVLNSDGGRIFEARGIAKLIGERQLATYVYRMCQSACATAFIAGSPRHLGEQGRLGFHQYRLHAINPFIDVAEEQEKDRAFFRSRGIAPDLLARIFETPHETMWYPTPDELMNANVINEIIPHKAM